MATDDREGRALFWLEVGDVKFRYDVEVIVVGAFEADRECLLEIFWGALMEIASTRSSREPIASNRS